jgi:hypothetical protein
VLALGADHSRCIWAARKPAESARPSGPPYRLETLAQASKDAEAQPSLAILASSLSALQPRCLWFASQRMLPYCSQREQ